MWGKKNPPTEPIEVPDDVAEAREMRQEATAEHHAVVSQGFAISQLSGWLNERRALNHFGDSIQITFTRRSRA
jgi:hypothetical protein